MNKKPKILLYDIENSPNVGTYFQLYKEGNIVWKVKDWYLLSFSYKWLGEKKTYVKSLPDYKTYEKDKENDIELVQDLWKLFDEADIIIGHNSNSFDNKKSNVRFLYHGLTPPTPYKTVDTKLVAKKYFNFDSNKLNDLGKFLGLGEKEDTGGYELWKNCMEGDKKAWSKMCKYNKQDVILLERIYLKLLPWMTSHPNIAVLNNNVCACPNCGSKKVQKRGFARSRSGGTFQRWQCQSCASWHQSTLGDNKQIR